MEKTYNIDNAFRITHLYTAFKTLRKSDYRFRGELHNFWEIVVVLDGKVGITAGSDIYTLTKGQGFIHEPMEFHRLWSENIPSEIIVISFEAENMPLYSSKVFKLDDTSSFEAIFSDIHAAFEFRGDRVIDLSPNNSFEHQIAVKQLEIFLLGTIAKKSEKKIIASTRSARNYTVIVNCLENNLNKSLKLSEIAGLCNMSEVNLTKTFSKFAGIGVMAYFNQLKINAAVLMLRSGTSVKETATALGFQEQNYFSKVFKRITGNSPTYYKNQTDSSQYILPSNADSTASD